MSNVTDINLSALNINPPDYDDNNINISNSDININEELSKYKLLMTDIVYDLTCTLCNKLYSDILNKNPITLSCGHTFCRNCLITWFETNNICPVDRNKPLIPDNGIDAIGVNFNILKLAMKLYSSNIIKNELEIEPQPIAQLAWGSLGTGNINLNRPYGVNVDINTKLIYVADYGNHRIMVFDSEGNFVRKFGGYGSGDTQLNSPYGVALSHDCTEVYVSDTFNHRIVVYSPTGEYIRKFPLEGGSTAAEIAGCLPVCLWASKDNKLYISDNGNHRILVYNSSGVYMFKFGSFGISDRQFNRPYAIGGLETDPSIIGEGDDDAVFCSILVADYANHRICVFDSEGNLKFNIGGYGAGNGQLNSPFGFACGNGNVYVTDTYNHRISVFSASNGRFIKALHADQFGQQGLPVAASFDPSSNTLFTSDNGLHCIRALKL